jgi:protein-disulfide isomerase
MMCLKLSEVNLLIKFFTEYICPINKAAFNTFDKIEMWNDEGGILKDEPNH